MVRQIQCQLRFTGSTDKPTWKKGFIRFIAVDIRHHHHHHIYLFTK